MSQQDGPLHPFDERSKTFYTNYFGNQDIRSRRQFEVFSRGKSIDILTECLEKNVDQLQETCFSHFRRVNSVELKGPHDPLTTSDLNLIITRIWAVGGQDRIEREEREKKSTYLSDQTLKEIADHPNQRTVTIVCVTRPDRILNTPEIQAEFGFVPTSEPGVYKSAKLLIPTWIIHPDELMVTPRNYPLLPLSRGEKLGEFIEVCLENGWEFYLNFIVDIARSLDPSEVFEKIMEVLHMNVKLRPETFIKFDQLLRDVPELITQLDTLRERIDHAVEVATFKSTLKGREEGREEGREKGIEKGIEKREREIARNMLEKEMDVSLISELTGLTSEDIRFLEEVTDDIKPEQTTDDAGTEQTDTVEV